MDDNRRHSANVPATPAFTHEMEALLLTAAGKRLPVQSRVQSVVRSPLVVAIVAAAILLMVVVSPWPGGGATPARAAVGMVFPDGQAIDVMGAVLGDGDLHTVRQRLSDVGVGLVLRESPSQPAAVGRVIRIELPPGAQLDGDRRMVASSGRGGSVILDIGIPADGGSTAGRVEPLTLDTHPELCAAIDAHDPLGSASRLADLGYRVRWDLVTAGGRGGHDKAVTEQRTELAQPQENTFIISVLASDVAGSSPDDQKRLIIETTPNGATWHAPTRVCR